MPVNVYFINGQSASVSRATKVEAGIITRTAGSGTATIDLKDEQGTIVSQFFLSQIVGYDIEPPHPPAAG